jgi:hypothetical protein
MPYPTIKPKDKLKNSLDLMRENLIDQYTCILKTIVYLNSVSQSNGTIVESIEDLNNQIIRKLSEETDNGNITTAEEMNQSNKQQNILSVMNYLKFTGFIDYYIDNMKKDKITITISPVISAFLLQYYFEIINVLDNPHNSSPILKDSKHKEDEKILLLQKLFVTSSLIGSTGTTGASQSTALDY